MTIHLLAPEIVSRIAAGEVIEWPASVVKELIENSLDAGATEISVEAVGGGILQIRVVDNGSGISSEDLDMAFRRYATSKIGSLKDMEKIATLGFRGEALASVAAAAQVDMLTRTASQEAGVMMALDSGEIVRRISQAGPVGTAITVRNLFRKIPARLKFLRSTSVENNHISAVVSQFCLAFPEVKFTLFIDGRPGLRTSGGGKLIEAIASVHGLAAAQQMIEVGGKPGPLYGYVSHPSVSRSNRTYLSFFVNRRWTQSRLLSRAAEDAYQGLLMAGRHPLVIVNLSLPLTEVDVNVHPAKTEVRFQNEGNVFNLVRGVINQALIEKVRPPEVHVDSKLRPLTELQQRLLVPEPEPVRFERIPDPPVLTGRMLNLPLLRVLGQVSSSYIIAEGPDGLYLVDQHAAHERVLFEKVMDQRGNEAVEAQGLLEPVAVEVSPAQEEQFKKLGPALAGFGFEIEPFGERVLLVRAVPAPLMSNDVSAAVIELLDAAEPSDGKTGDERLAATVACHGAVRAGQALDHREMLELLQALEKTRQPRTCPHGRPTMIHLSSTQLEREFGRA